MVRGGGERSIIITGCSSGIGYCAAHRLTERGWQVFATCRSARDCEQLEREGLRSLVLDCENPESIRTAFETVMAETGGQLGAVFNNGAYAIPGAVEDLPSDALRAIFQTNLFGGHELVRLALPVMRRQGHGRIIQNSSILGLLALRYRGAYVATKFAMEGLTDTLRMELSDTPIHVILIEPGPIDTPIRIKSRPHFRKWVDWENSAHSAMYEKEVIPRLEAESVHTPFELGPDAVVKRLVKALESENPRARYRVTIPTHALGLARRLLPTRMFDAVALAIMH